MDKKYGIVRDDISIEEANKIIDENKVEIIICTSILDTEVLDILDSHHITIYHGVTSEEILIIKRQLNKNKIEFAALDYTPEETSNIIEESMKTGKPLPFTMKDMWPVNIIKKD